VSLGFTILNSSGPFREPREPVFSYDYTIQRPAWPTPHGVRIKISVPDELEYAKTKILNLEGGTPGQILIINQILSREIADRKLAIVAEDGMLNQRQDVLIAPFTGTMAHLFPKLDAWLIDSRDRLRDEVQKRVGAIKAVSK